MAATKTITDPLYGSIILSETEAKIVSSRAFQRLHNVRQLGLAHLVFPSAGYSRFAHSVGALHNASRMIDAISDNASKVSPERKAAYRVAALLHDVGHYPFSHATEHTLADYYAGSLFTSSSLVRRDGAAESINHEDVGAIVLQRDPEINRIIQNSSDVSMDMLRGIFSTSAEDSLFGVISSDLDCDRLDYLARTSLLGGVPYGNVDVDFIISKSTMGRAGQLAFEAKAAKAIDHLLVSRYYDYMQMVHHKTVEALEWSLSEAIRFALDHEDGLLSKAFVESKIDDGTWWRIDDSWFISKLKYHEGRANASAGMAVVRDHLAAILYRRPAKRLWKWEALLDRDDSKIETTLRLTRKVVDAIATEMGIEPARFWINNRKFKFVKMSHHDTSQGEFEEESAKAVLLKVRGREQFLVERDELMLKTLSRMRNFAVNVYYLPTKDEPKSVRDELRARIHKEMAG